ncbi:hypothetical protein B14_200177 (plasmid) [Bacillus licheniformis]|uniref:hypothetical protein n=1 Tax=Bacillus licheniformis TaxID=1402 RepID=UPI0009B73666|nr:hypothetical protein [Bacillus licheniformis]ARC67388.1 hypothetical protein B14_200177 [Bacillus licheniformis]ARW46203.1 hypothetical protein S100141_04985 [Bacillus licheniformis]MDE1421818.1 hypothetical protein [Bacillus licheniformis]MEC0475823.1 hypothetical protein [Bacillus licheniformis]RHL11886.1 hypothetical protein DW032_19845 [Bacillus licheniformis]
MLFSYYFDTRKMHVLNCHFRVIQFAEKAEGEIEIIFTAEISEKINGITKKSETKTSTFKFPASQKGETKHDIDFTRVRYAEQKKWIFTVKNNKDTRQSVTIGLISSTANKNPLGLDVYHDSSEFDAQLKANNLSILEKNYNVPVLTQTLVYETFDNAGYPDKFSSFTAQYDETGKNYTVKDFRQDFLEEIPERTAFTIKLDLAPLNVDPVAGSKIFTLEIPNLGEFNLTKISFDYLIHNGTSSDYVRAYFDEALNVSDFYKEPIILNKAKLIIEGDGEGNLSATYAGKTIKAVYDSTQTFSYINFKGGLNTSKEEDQSNVNNLIPSKLDNISVTYHK